MLKMAGARASYMPDVDRLAENAFFFDQQYVSSFPTVPNREDIMTGKYSFPHRGWGPLHENAVTAAEILSGGGHLTQLICDTPHLIGSGHGYHKGFDAYNWIRGNECDIYMTKYNHAIEVAMPTEKTRVDKTIFGHHLADFQLWINPEVVREQDTFVARTAKTVSQWIEDNYRCKDFFLWVDTFELHEPYIPPAFWRERYCDPDYKGPMMTYPIYGPCKGIYSKDETRNMWDLYCGETSLTSRWIGHILRKLEDVGVYDDTMLVITSDHGTYIGEHGRAGKMFCSGPKRDINSPWPQHDEVNRTPLIVKMPGQKRGRRIRQLVQPVDYLPTLVDLCGIKTDLEFDGFSLKPLLEGGKVTWPRRQTYSSNSIRTRYPIFHTGINTTQWQLHLGGEEHEGPILFDRVKDPNGTRNVAKANPAVVQRMGREYIRFLEKCKTDPAKIEVMEKRLR
jgi:arylsulfatase A-like enzyme